jgi:hypothetical protein
VIGYFAVSLFVFLAIVAGYLALTDAHEHLNGRDETQPRPATATPHDL